MEILEKADKLLRTGSSEDIQDFLPEIVATYCKLDDMQESQLRSAYEKATKEEDLDLPFTD